MVEEQLGLIYQIEVVIIVVLKQLVWDNPLVLVLAIIKVLLQHVLVAENAHGGHKKRPDKGKMRWHALLPICRIFHF